jgi:thiol:disulfide interchange protein DsbD
VLGLSVVFAVVGCVIAFVGGSVQSVINSIYVRAFIALIFVALSLSMFGLYQIGLPSSVTTKMQDLGQKTRKNLIGLFALGMLSALIVSPCGGPIILAVLVRIGEIGSISIGFLMMILLAWGMGLLLVAAGTFPNLVPRSGMWMEKVKVIFGFLLLWGALYYISPYIAEGVYYIGIALLAVFGSVFLGCWDGITAESGLAQRILRAVGILLILMAIFFGFQGVAELTGAGFTGSQSAAEKVDPLTNGDEANVAAAIGAGKPVLLDFWAKWCAYCNDLDKYTYSDPRVVAELARFRAFRIDFDKQHALNDKYAVKLPPKVVIIDSDGKIREDLSFTGFKNADELLAILKQVK